MITEITIEQARAQFGDAPIKALERDGLKLGQLFLVADGEVLGGDLIDPTQSAAPYPYTWCPDIDEWDAH